MYERPKLFTGRHAFTYPELFAARYDLNLFHVAFNAALERASLEAVNQGIELDPDSIIISVEVTARQK